MRGDRFSSLDVCRESGLTYRRLDCYTRLGLFPGLLDPTPGSGAIRSYSAGDMARARTIRELTSAGVSSAEIRRAFSAGAFDRFLDDLIDAATRARRETVGV